MSHCIAAHTFGKIDPSASPCGFCGRPERVCAGPTLTKGSPQARSECPYYRLFFYQPSLKPSATTPSTNVPILCRIPECKVEKNGNWSAVWKYNMPEHLRIAHPAYSRDGTGIDGLIPLPPLMIHEMHISDEEEHALGIPLTHIPHKASLPELPPTEVSGTAPGGSRRGAKRRRICKPATSTQTATGSLIDGRARIGG